MKVQDYAIVSFNSPDFVREQIDWDINKRGTEESERELAWRDEIASR